MTEIVCGASNYTFKFIFLCNVQLSEECVKVYDMLFNALEGKCQGIWQICYFWLNKYLFLPTISI